MKMSGEMFDNVWINYKGKKHLTFNGRSLSSVSSI